MTEQVRTVIIGGGQAGLALSYCLTQRSLEHIVLERAAQAGNVWRNHRWDSFTLVTPNWQLKLPGMEYQGDDPDGFMPRVEVVAYLERYIECYRLPVRYGTEVTAVERKPGGDGYLVKAGETVFDAGNVVVATGSFQQSRVPTFAARLPAGIAQLGSGDYRNPQALPPGAVLVVGSAQSGCQIAEELYQSGRKVYLCVGSAGRVPRRYRGKDITWWLYSMGWFDQTVDRLPSPRAKYAAMPHLSGKGGGHALNLHQFARDGVVLLGHLQGADGGVVSLAPNLQESLARADKFEADLLRMVDSYIESSGADAPTEKPAELRDGYDVAVRGELDLEAEGIASIIWATGYTFDFSLVKLPVVDGDGYPLQNRGATAYPGLYFLGLHWLRARKSGLFLGIGEDAAYIADRIAAG